MSVSRAVEIERKYVVPDGTAMPPLHAVPGCSGTTPQPVAAPRLPNRVWFRRHALPWLLRRIRRISSGDGLGAKQPQPRAIDSIEWR